MAGRLHPVQLSWRRRRVPVAERTRRQKVMAYVGGVWDVSAWAFVALLSVVAVSRRVGGTAPTLLQPLQAVVPLLFLPIKAGPEVRVLQWLASYGKLVGDFDRQSLRKWKQGHPGQRSFAVLRHPVARAYAAYADVLAQEAMPELRPYLKRVHKFELPPKGKGFATLEEHRAGFAVVLTFVKYLLDGRTELKTPAQFASLGAILAGFAQVQSPDVLIREDRLETGLRHLAEEVGVAFQPLLPDAAVYAWPLAAVYGPDIEAAAKEAYWRDYNGFGFETWVDRG